MKNRLTKDRMDEDTKDEVTIDRCDGRESPRPFVFSPFRDFVIPSLLATVS